MKSKSIFVMVLWLILVIGVSGCGDNGTVPSTALKLGPNLLIETQGAVQIKRKGWANYVPVSFGVDIHPYDLVRPATGQTVTILCADLELHRLEQEDVIPCNVDKPSVLLYDEYRVHDPKAENVLIPYILHPRNSKVLDAHPLLRWYDSGATSYKVALYQDGELVWEQSGVQGAEIRYPDNAPALPPGKNYLLEVTDEKSGHNSGEDAAQGLGFEVLSAEERATIEAREKQIRALPIEESAQKFALAVYYAGQGVRGEALRLLDEITPTFDVPTIQLWRGQLLLAMQLSDDADSAYRVALERANRLGHKESQAAAQAGLWRATKEEAAFNEAIKIYEELGDQSAIEELQKELNDQSPPQ